MTELDLVSYLFVSKFDTFHHSLKTHKHTYAVIPMHLVVNSYVYTASLYKVIKDLASFVCIVLPEGEIKTKVCTKVCTGKRR